MAKKAAAASVVLLLLAGAWWATREGDGVGPAGSDPPGLRVAEGRAPLAPASPEARGDRSGPEPTPPARGPAAPSLVTGVVVDGDDAPVPGALVVVIPDDLSGPMTPAAAAAPGGAGRSGRTDAEGRFALPMPDAAGGTLLAEADGFAPTAWPELPRRGAEIRVVLVRAAALAGRVIDADGAPVPGARVTLHGLLDAFRYERSAVSGPDGAYRIEGVGPRRRLPRPHFTDAVIEARAEGFAPLRVPLQGAGAALAAFAEPGEEGRLDLRLLRGASLRGSVIDGESGAPVEGARVVLLSLEATTYVGLPGGREHRRGLFVPAPLGETRSAADGTFRFDGLPARGSTPVPMLVSSSGKRGLQLGIVGAMKDGYAPFTEEVPVAADGAVVEATLRLFPAAAVTGRVVDAEGRPVAGAGVRVEVEGREENAWLPPEHYPGLPSVAGRTDAEGRYRLDGARAARAGPTAARVLAVRSGSVMLRQPGGVPVEVRAGATTEAPDIVLAGPPDAAVEFVVVDAAGEPVFGAAVTGSLLAFSGRTGRDGRVVLRSPIHGGSYDPAAPPELVFTVHAPGLARTQVRAAPSTTEAKEVRVVLGAAHRIAGVVREADGSPASPGTTLCVVDASLPPEEAFTVDRSTGVARGLLAWGRLDDGGRFAVEDLPAGPYHVRAERSLPRTGARSFTPVRGTLGTSFVAQGGSPGVARHATAAGVAPGATDLVLVLPPEETPPTEAVEGTVVDAASGEPLPIRWIALHRDGEAATGGPEPGGPGRFRFAAVPAGEWTLQVACDDRVPATVEGIRVSSGAPPAPLQVRMARGATVLGRLRAPPGTDIAGAMVLLLDPGRASYPARATVDAAGGFRATGVGPGRHRVLVSPTGGRPGAPHALGPAGAAPLPVPEGAVEVAYDADLVPCGEVVVRVEDPRLPPAEGEATPAQRDAGAGARVEVRDGGGTLLAEHRGLRSGMPVALPGIPAGEVEVSVHLGAGEVRRVAVVVRAGERTGVRP